MALGRKRERIFETEDAAHFVNCYRQNPEIGKFKGIGGIQVFPDGSVLKNLPAMRATWVQSLDQEVPLEKEMATHSNILAWEIAWGHKRINMTQQLNNKKTFSFYLCHHCWHD